MKGSHSAVPSSSHWIILNGIRLIVQDLREASRAAEARLGLSGAQIFVLQTLAETPGISVNELSARTYTHQSSVSVVLKRLIQRGLVRAAPARPPKSRCRSHRRNSNPRPPRNTRHCKPPR